MSRTVVIPLARRSGSMNCRLPSGSPAPVRWTCMSASPGMRNLPEASTTCVPAGMDGVDDGATSAMRSRSRRTVMSARGGRPVPSTTVTCVIASVGFSPAPQAQRHDADRSSGIARRTRFTQRASSAAVANAWMAADCKTAAMIADSAKQMTNHRAAYDGRGRLSQRTDGRIEVATAPQK